MGGEPYTDPSNPDNKYLVSDEDECKGEMGSRARNRNRKIHYHPNTVVPYWELGMIFDSFNDFRNAVSKYAVLRGVDLSLRSNEPSRMGVK